MVEHCDDDTLSLIALGEPGSAVDEQHLQTCARCQSRLDQLTAVVSSARTISEGDRPTMPPASVWTAISDELGLRGSADVVALDERRPPRGRRTWLVAAAAAVVGILAGGVLTAGLLRATPGDQVIAQAPLAPIADSGYSGTAEVERSGDTNVLVVNVPGLPDVPDGYYEVWMATPDTSKMVALGTLNAGHVGTFTLPAGMDMASYPVVDVSLEHFDGNPGHSATSVVRGQLPA